ncbi:hypothetical protein D3C76_1340130 [compost metagenome]
MGHDIKMICECIGFGGQLSWPYGMPFSHQAHQVIVTQRLQMEMIGRCSPVAYHQVQVTLFQPA